jgi:uncharacterized membrane protein YfcA
MNVEFGTYSLLAVSAFFAGGMNAIAGGGTFLTFPALVFAGVPSIIANASSTVALFPASFSAAWAYRKELKAFEAARSCCCPPRSAPSMRWCRGCSWWRA